MNIQHLNLPCSCSVRDKQPRRYYGEEYLSIVDTMRLDDLGGGAVTPPQRATSIHIPAELAKAIFKEIKLSPST